MVTDNRILITDSAIERFLINSIKEDGGLYLIAAYGCQDQLRVVVKPRRRLNLGEITVILSTEKITWTHDKKQIVLTYHLLSSSRPLTLRVVEMATRGSIGLLFGPIFGALGGLVACQISERIIQSAVNPSTSLRKTDFITFDKRRVCINLDKHDAISKLADYRLESLKNSPEAFRKFANKRMSLLDAFSLDSIDMSPEGITLSLALPKLITSAFSILKQATTGRGDGTEPASHINS